MKKVFSNVDMVIHVWAQQNQDEGRNGSSSCSFDKGELYSYATRIATIVPSEATGEKVALISDVNYSVTTSRQQSSARAATNHLKRMNVRFLPGNRRGQEPRSDGWKADNMAHYAACYAKALSKLTRARTEHEALADDLNRIQILAMEFSYHFNMPFDSDRFKALAAIAGHAKATKERRALIQAEIEKDLVAYETGDETVFLPRRFCRNANAEQTVRANIETAKRWKAGKEHYDMPEGETFLRIRGDQVETSRRASFPVTHAIKAWPVVKECKENGVTWVKNGKRAPLGNFEIDRVEADGTVIAGRHTVLFSEIEAIAKQLNLI